MNVLDTTEARDLLACAGAVLSSADGASLFRVSALPQWSVDPEKLRALVRAIPRDPPPNAMYEVMKKVEGGAEVVAAIQSAREQIESTQASAHAALCIIAQKFQIDRSAPPVTAILEFAHLWESKPLTKTKTLGEFLEYLQYFREAGGAVCAPPITQDAVRLMTAHGAKGWSGTISSSSAPTPIRSLHRSKKRWWNFLPRCWMKTPWPKLTERNSAIRKSGGFFMLP